MIELRQLSIENIEEIKIFFFNVFTKEPWNDDWSDEKQLHQYITDLIGNPNSLTYALFRNKEMLGISMGSIKHWYTGTEYYISEFCVKTEEQGSGLGTYFLKSIENSIKEKGMTQIFLQTEREVPAYRFYKKNGFLDLEGHVSLVKTLE